MSGNLLSRIREAVVGVIHLFLQDLVLNGDYSGEKNVIFGFGLNSNIQLLDSVTNGYVGLGDRPKNISEM